MSDLRKRLTEVKLAGVKTVDGYAFRTNEDSAACAVTVVATWLREGASSLRAAADQVGDPQGDGAARLVIHEARAMEILADAITKDSGGDAHHHYLSTSCYHDRPELHRECQVNVTRWDGTPKIAAQCKVCGSGCVCPCHR
jgi:hypothetical protein